LDYTLSFICFNVVDFYVVTLATSYTKIICSFTGRLPSPENVQINVSLIIEWDPPYTAINNNDTSIMHVDPHITQYTVYIIDKYTGNYMDKVNVTKETFSRNIPDVHSCPTYGVTAWNSGGEGHMSPPLPGGKLTFYPSWLCV